jgi:chromosome segregation ATPase
MIRGILKLSALLSLFAVALAGGTYLLAGPARAKAVMSKVQTDLRTRIDQSIDDPTALRARLQQLEKEYPQRIAQVRGDLAELEEQIRQLRREEAVSNRVVELVDQDLGRLESQVLDAAAVKARTGDARAALVAFDEHVYTLDRATTKLNQLRQTRVAYQGRAAGATHDLTYVEQQAARLRELRDQLEAERAQFQAQLWQLERQVDSIARNDRLIVLLEKRNRTIEECSRFDVVSLDQVSAQLAQVRHRQEAQLDVLASAPRRESYEEAARMELEAQRSLEAKVAPALDGSHDLPRLRGGRAVITAGRN